MMTVNTLVQQAGGNVPLDSAEVLAMNVSDISTDELKSRVCALTALQEATGLLRAKYLREIRDRDYPVTGKDGKEGDQNTREGWDEYLKKNGLDRGSTNAEIRGLAALEAAGEALGLADSETFGREPAHAQKSIEISNTLLGELGRANGCATEVAERILTGKLVGKRQVRQAVKDAKADARVQGIRSVKPKVPARPPSTALPLKPPPGGITFNLADYRGHPVAMQQRADMEAMLEKIRKAAVAYCNAVKKLSDFARDGLADDRNFPAHMTALAIVWKEEGYDRAEAIASVVSVLGAAANEWGLAMDMLHGSASIVDE